MDQFFLKFTLPPSEISFRHGDGIILTGSCFSDEISRKLKNAGHTVYSNPHGTIFHPSVLAFNLLDSLNEHPDERIFERDGNYYTWNASSLISGKTKKALQEKLLHIKSEFRQRLVQSRLLIVTFGTAWGYELKETKELTANCHKMPSQLFTKFLSSPYELVQDWILAIEHIQAVNPELHIVFTVSPVRHTRDGLAENNLSKARLLEAVHQLVLEENTSYFPSYELITDVLRDYRFFKEDRVHPTEEAVDFVWKQFEQTFCTASTIELNHSVEKVNKMAQHQPAGNKEKQLDLIELKKKELSEKNSEIYWG